MSSLNKIIVSHTTDLTAVLEACLIYEKKHQAIAFFGLITFRPTDS